MIVDHNHHTSAKKIYTCTMSVPSLQEMSEDIQHVVHDCIRSLAEKDHQLLSLYEAKREEEETVMQLRREKEDLSLQLQSIIAATKELESGIAVMEQQASSYMMAVASIRSETFAIEKTCGVDPQNHTSNDSLEGTPTASGSVALCQLQEVLHASLVSLRRCRPLMESSQLELHRLRREANKVPSRLAAAHSQSLEVVEEAERWARRSLADLALRSMSTTAPAQKHLLLTLEDMENEVQQCRENEKTLTSYAAAMDAYRKRQELFEVFAEERILLLQRRCVIAEFMLRQVGYQHLSSLNGLTQQCKEWKNDKDAARQRHDAVVRTITEKYDARLSTAVKRSTELQSQLAAVTVKRDETEGKCQVFLQREHAARQKAMDAEAKQSQLTTSLGLRVKELEQENSRLIYEADVNASTKKALQDRVRQLEGIVEEMKLTATHSQSFQSRCVALDAKVADLSQEVERKAKALEDCNTLSEQLTRLNTRNSELQHETQRLHHLRLEDEQRRRHEGSEVEQEVRKMRKTLKTFCSAHLKCKRQLDVERCARSILENQQHTETQLMKSMMELTQNNQSSSSHGLKSENARMRARVAFLEHCCEKSACVIAELRESLIMEKQLSASRFSSPSTSSPAISTYSNPVVGVLRLSQDISEAVSL